MTDVIFMIFWTAAMAIALYLTVRYLWPLLLVASYVFYWCASPWYLLFIGVTTVSTYGVSRLLERVNNTQKTSMKPITTSVSFSFAMFTFISSKVTLSKAS